MIVRLLGVLSFFAAATACARAGFPAASSSCGDPSCALITDTCDTAQRNACGGCALLKSAPTDSCGTCGTYACKGTDALVCNDPGVNACGGCTALSAARGATCGTCGTYVCDGADALTCEEHPTNACGGCAVLVAAVGDPCGACGVWACNATGALTCNDPGANACGGCSTLSNAVGDPCGTCGQYVCNGTDALACDDPGLNACGGCATLPATVGDSCSVCGTYVCVGTDMVSCAHPGHNICGGCTVLEPEVGSACGTCGSLVCGGTDVTTCQANTPDYNTTLTPTSFAGATTGCTATDEALNDGTCGAWKVYPVTPGQWIGIEASDDDCAACSLYHVAFDIQEDSGSGWTTYEHHDPEPDSQGMLYATNYVPASNAVRIITTNDPGFYVRVYGRGLENGGFESGAVAPASGVASTLTPAITSDPTFVAGRGAFSYGVASPCTDGSVSCNSVYAAADALLWGVSYPLSCPAALDASSEVTFDTYGQPTQIGGLYIVPYAHYHVQLTFNDSSTDTFDSYIKPNGGIQPGWSSHRVDVSGDAGRVLSQITISFHKDLVDGTNRPEPGIFIDNVTLR